MLLAMAFIIFEKVLHYSPFQKHFLSMFPRTIVINFLSMKSSFHLDRHEVTCDIGIMKQLIWRHFLRQDPTSSHRRFGTKQNYGQKVISPCVPVLSCKVSQAMPRYSIQMR